MPIYEYQCEECGVRFERLQSMSAPTETTCPECGGRVHRVISSVGVIFKGSGFYVTDNRKSSSSANRRSKSNGEGDAGSAKDDSTTKAAAKETESPTSKETE
jgi:putative FmdB family regulatory protein